VLCNLKKPKVGQVYYLIWFQRKNGKKKKEGPTEAGKASEKKTCR
jgi:hypothetical protein